MNLKRLFIVLIVGTQTCILLSQEFNIDFFEKLYNKSSYNELIKYAENKGDMPDVALFLLAESYRLTLQNSLAIKTYEKYFLNKTYNPDELLKYIFFLRDNEMYEQTYKWAKEYYSVDPNDKRVQSLLDNYDFYKTQANKKEYIINNVGINTPESEFGVAFYKNDQIVFSSSFNYTGSSKVVARQKKENTFLDLYTTTIPNIDNIEMVVPFAPKINKKYNEGPVCFSANSQIMILTRNNYRVEGKGESIGLQLFSVKYNGNSWSAPSSVSFNSNTYSVAHPTLSEDGTMLIFASNMPGGYGGTDLYISNLKKNGSWDTPQNLGGLINTEGNEQFPFLHPEGILFFASDGHYGLGGLDLFSVQFIDEEYQNLKNLGQPINSSSDDFSLVFDNGFKKGFFSSNRPGGKGSDDIYSLIIDKPSFVDVELLGSTKDLNYFLIDNVDITVYDNNNNIVTSTRSDQFGNFQISIPAGYEYMIVGKKQGYQQTTIYVVANKDGLKINSDIILKVNN